MQKIQGISGLRGIVALLIVFYHLQQLRPIVNLSEWDWAMYQFFNMLPVVVVVFFILTGFLRSLAYWEHIFYDAKKPLTSKVLLDRWWRIAPAYYVVLLVSFGWSIYISGFDFQMVSSLFSGFTFFNWISPSTFFPVPLNGPLWFIGYDMMGYIATVVMMLGLTRIPKQYIIPIIVLYVAVLLFLHFAFISLPWTPGSGIVSVWFPYYNPFIFGLYFLMGIIIGGIVTRFHEITKSMLWDIVFLLTVVSIGTYLWIIRGAPDLAYSYPTSPYRFPLVPGLWAIAIFALIYSRYIGKWLDNRIFLWLASISYSLYLWHGLIIDMLITMIGSMYISSSFLVWGIFSMVSLMVSFVVASLSVRYIEGLKRH